MDIKKDKPKFYRQRILLSLLHFMGKNISRTDLHKHSFLFSVQNPMGYDFVPYQYGCYSFQLDKDLSDLSEQGFIEVVDKKIGLKVDNPIIWLKTKDSNSLFKYPEAQKQLKGDELIKFVYDNHPFYAINSQIKNICGSATRKKITQERNKLSKNNKVIYTIGYEGISIEAYINKLIRNDIKLLLDVRKNPFSRKFGFSYKALNNILPKLGIEYAHIPELGIESNKRQNLDDKLAYKKLFDEYKTTLPDKNKALAQVLDLQKKYHRIALTCFEKYHRECHRHCVSDYLVEHHKVKSIHL